MSEERTLEQLFELQAKPLDEKIYIAQSRIMQFYNYLNGKVYISFSGGKDSTVLLHLARQIYPELTYYAVDITDVSGISNKDLVACAIDKDFTDEYFVKL